ncbi:MAG: hypothetical protein ACOCUY_02350 [Verrucomicrobiota bacterium]
MCCKDKNQSCEQPENLKGTPQDCTPEQVRKCHGDAESHPCVESAGCCEHPEHLKGKPGECSPEQIQECHGK